MEFKGTKVFPKYEGGDNYSIDMIFESGATISIDRRDRYSDKLVMEREEMEANAKAIECTTEMLEMLFKVRDLFAKRQLPNEHEVNTFHSNISELLEKATTI